MLAVQMGLMQHQMQLGGQGNPFNQDDSLNFSNLESSLAPSMHNDSIMGAKQTSEIRERQFIKLKQQQEAIKQAQLAEQKEFSKKKNINKNFVTDQSSAKKESKLGIMKQASTDNAR